MQAMKQLSQNMRTGKLVVEEVPEPVLQPGFVLVRNAYSLISAGTERQKIEMGKKSLLGKARARPDLVKKVVDKVKTDGIVKTARTVLTRLDTPTPLGYSCAGVVLGAAEDVEGMPPGTRVACGGADYAVHAEVVAVPKNLCVPVPEGVSLREAAMATVGAIALQGIRQADLRLGETAAVIGLGLVGQIACQLLSAAGCRVIGVDIDPAMVEITKAGGLEHAIVGEGGPAAAALAELTGGRGVDATLLCAATPSDGPINLAGEITRNKGVVVAVGLVGLNVPRDVFYEKELDLRLSRSYGPGRYDPSYEEKGHDYPYAYVRWTEARNMAGFLDLLAKHRIHLDHILTHEYPFEEATEAYRLLAERTEPCLGITLSYPETAERTTEPIVIKTGPAPPATDTVGIGVIGAGNYVQSVLLPILRRLRGATLVTVADASGLTAKNVARKFRFLECAPDVGALLADARVGLVVIGTRHDSHADLVCEALRAGKNVHVEKPLALSARELGAVRETHESSGGRLTVGFNRRFAPATVEAMHFLERAAGPQVVVCRVNAGALPSDHWLLDRDVGGGRMIGEGCHFIDLLCFLAGSRPVRVRAVAAGSQHSPRGPRTQQDVVAHVEFADGSVGNLVYTSCGDRSIPKERIEVMTEGHHVVVDDFRAVTLAFEGRRKRKKLGRQDKGQRAMLEAEIEAIRSGRAAPIRFEALVDSTLATLAVVESLRSGRPVEPASLLVAREDT